MRYVELLLSIPRSIVYNFFLFPINVAIKCPVLLSYRTKIAELHKGNIVIAKKISPEFGMIKIGFSGTEGIYEEATKSYIQIRKNSKIIFNGNAFFGKGVTIRINGGRVEIGSNFWANRKLLLSSHTGITIGDDFLAGWGCSIQDSSNHTILCNGEPKSETNEIIIGNHVWFGSEVVCLKGAQVLNNSVVAMRGVLTKKFDEPNVLLGGVPAKIIQHDISWHK